MLRISCFDCFIITCMTAVCYCHRCISFLNVLFILLFVNPKAGSSLDAFLLFENDLKTAVLHLFCTCLAYLYGNRELAYAFSH